MFIITLLLWTGIITPVLASNSREEAGKALSLAADYLLQKEKDKGFLSPWSYIALAAAERDLKATLVDQACEKMLAVATRTGEMNDYAVLVLTVLAAGKDPYNYEGRNLIREIQDAQLASGKFADNLISGGERLANAHFWAIIALKAAGADIPERDKALAWLVVQQHADGSFYWDAMDKSTSDVDSTGMALMALGALGEKEDSSAVRKAVTYLQEVQKEDGGFFSWMGDNAESCCIVIQGLTAVGIDSIQGKFNKTKGNPLSALLRFQLPDGSFEHITGSGSNEMSTQQALLALSGITTGRVFYERLKGSEAHTLGREILFTVGCNYYTLTAAGKRQVEETDAAAFIENGRTYVPVRYLARALGVPDSGIGWEEDLQAVKLTLKDTTLTLIIGSDIGYVNGLVKPIGVAPLVVKGRTYLPARFVAEAFGYRVKWMGESRTVCIKK